MGLPVKTQCATKELRTTVGFSRYLVVEDWNVRSQEKPNLALPSSITRPDGYLGCTTTSPQPVDSC